MFSVCAIVLLCLTSLSHSAPLACETLVRPLDQLDPHHLEGRWAMVAGSLSDLSLMERLASRDSATFSFSSNTSETYTIFSRSAHVENKCYYSSENTTLKGNKFTFDNGSINMTFIHTSCHDCIVVSCVAESGKRHHFYLFSRRRQLEQKEMEEFSSQVQCLDMPPPVVMDPTNELCPEQTASDPATQTEEKTH
ncbi:hypothetical protein EXN66_Car003213 [Channa argus]|uniref:Uncharacterized protein n=1 Tax=Channa argus TaxID=215402 RepID=A0A6G1PB66_CHAAH|nr:hypothetical protein EXN66_Car003213 [Channa argus]